MNNKDFNILNTDIIYLDNASTTLKPKIVVDTITDYYNNYSSNIGRAGYNIEYKAYTKYEETRDIVKEFINAKKREEIIFTSGTTESINTIVNGFFSNYLKDNDEVLLTKAEHASNVLPWQKLNNIKIKYIDLDNYLLTLDNIKKSITDKTKVISIAMVTNVLGDTRPIKEICNYAHKHNILVVVDLAQAISHIKIDVQDLDIDFAGFSSHKICGPTGVGVLYAKYKYLDKLIPQNVGGGMNNDFYEDKFTYKDLPYRLEAGTPNIAGVIGLGSAIKYINNIGIDNINNYITELRNYAINKLSKLDNIEIYNKHIDSTTIVFNVKKIHSEDVSTYLNKHNICIRSGNHCAKLLKDIIGVTNTCRVSLYFYNTKKDIDTLYNALNNKNILHDSL